MESNEMIMTETNELYHYGVKGMKWGVRRNLNRLRKANEVGDNRMHNKAVKKLNAHRDKATKKIEKLDTKHDKLQAKREKQVLNTASKAADLNNRAARLRLKQNRRLMTEGRRERIGNKAAKLERRANAYTAQIEQTKARIAKNRKMRELFSTGIDDINVELITKGQDFLFDD